MRPLRNLAERVRKNEPIPAPLAALLEAATLAQRTGMWWRLRGPRERVDARVISFGNVTAGGVGKTPAVLERAGIEMAAGHKVAILTRGYGSRDSAPVCHVGEGGMPSREVRARLGDEPALLAWKLPGAVIVKNPNRVAGANLAVERHGCDTLILDDGFQYVRLTRDEDVVLVDATNPLGNGRLIPRGILREPPRALARATAIVLTRCDLCSGLDAVLREIRRYCPDTPIRKTRHAPCLLWRPADGAELPLDALRGRRVRALCGIGRPEAFFRTLESLGADLASRAIVPDHGAVQPGLFDTGETVVVTEKDAMRIDDPPPHVLALGIRLQDWA